MINVNSLFNELSLNLDLETLLLPSERELDSVEQQLNKFKNQSFDTIFIIATGASALNIKALLSSINILTINLHFVDTLDVGTINRITSLVTKNSLFIVISRSGNTYEVNLLTEYFATRNNSNNFYIIGPTGTNKLRQIACRFNLKQTEYPNCISGRFSPLLYPSLLVAGLVGVNIINLICTAKEHLASIGRDLSKIENNVINIITNCQLGRNNMMIMYYGEQINGLCQWICQLIAESLSKSGFGITPILIRGPIDQHSYLQLFLEGPDNKFYYILNVHNIIQNRKHSNLLIAMNICSRTVNQALVDFEKSVVYNVLTYLNEEVVAKYIVEYLITVLCLAKHYNVNPFNQPSVDRVKKILQQEY